MKHTFKDVSFRTFVRIENEAGEVVAYVAGRSRDQMQLRALVIAEALNAYEEKQAAMEKPAHGTTPA